MSAEEPLVAKDAKEGYENKAVEDEEKTPAKAPEPRPSVVSDGQALAA